MLPRGLVAALGSLSFLTSFPAVLLGFCRSRGITHSRVAASSISAAEPNRLVHLACLAKHFAQTLVFVRTHLAHRINICKLRLLITTWEAMPCWLFKLLSADFARGNMLFQAKIVHDIFARQVDELGPFAYRTLADTASGVLGRSLRLAGPELPWNHDE